MATGLAFQFFDIYYGKPSQNWSQKLLAKSKEEAKKSEPKVENPSPPMPLSNYIGEYHNPVYGNAVVKESDHELRLIMGRNKKEFILKPWDRDIFITSWTPYEDEMIKVLFVQGDNDKIGIMQIDTLMAEGSGEFEKVSQEESTKTKPSTS